MPSSPVGATIGVWAPGTISKISQSNNTSCAVADGKAYCWGRNTSGQLGIGSTANSPIPVAVSTTGVLNGKTVTDISVGLNYVCAIADGAIYCWGVNTYGQFGNNSTTASNLPVATIMSGDMAGKTATHVTAGDGHVCALASGVAYCWGTNGGRLGNNTTTASRVPVAVDATGALAGKTLTDIDVGSSSSCAIASGAAFCWGTNTNSQLGDNTAVTKRVPTPVSTSGVLSGKTVTDIAVGNDHACVIANSSVYCWGYNAASQLGDNTTTTAPVPISPLTSGPLSGAMLTKVDAGNSRTCVLHDTGAVSCWGSYSTGGSPLTSTVPVAAQTTGVLSGVMLKDVTAGSAVCASSTNQRVYCWGNNTYGELGNNVTGAASNAAVQVLANDSTANTAYRFYENTNLAIPGSPLEGDSSAATLTAPNQAFRMRTGVTNANLSGTPIDMRAGDITLKLQYAVKSVATCSAQTGFADVTATTPIAWNTNAGVANGASISSSGNDPSAGTIVYQSYRSEAGNFSNTVAIPNGSSGIWDFSLKDNNATPTNKTYCLKLVYSTGTALEQYVSYPEITTTVGTLSVEIVNASDAIVGSPSYALNNAFAQSICQAVTGTLGTSSQKIRVFNSFPTTGWSLSIAATGGVTAKWTRDDATQLYDYNDPTGATAGCGSGTDGDGLAGQLTLNTASGTLTPQSGCNATGVTLGSNAAFNHGVTDAITLMSSSASAQKNCNWYLTGVGLSQRIPASQASGTYALQMTMTVVAQ